uniref:HAT C-terminal dimerisation domain-containing protein n=1 Tax=Latimeria chalumnae TaxID=7897 RepID=H2ZWJ5_LATCH
ASSNTEDKLFPILIRFCKGTTREIKVGLLDLPVCTLSIADDLIRCVDQVLQRMKVPWQNCVSFSCNSTSINVGRHRSLRVHVENRAPKLYTLGCPCHLISMCFESSQFLVSEVLLWVFCYLDKSAKRNHLLKEHAEFVNVEYCKILKHSGTCWLSVGKCIERILMIMLVLRLFFQSEDLDKKQQTRDVCDLVCSPKTELYLLFVNSAITLFEDANKLLQCEAPMIHMVHGSMMELLQKVMIKFIRTEVLAEVLSLLAINYSDINNQVPNHDLLQQNSTCCALWSLQKARMTPSSSLQASWIESGLLSPDILCHEISKIISPGTEPPFPILTNLAKLVLTLPYSNADIEHLFSMVKKNKTDLRSSLSAETLCSLLKMKINCFKATTCYDTPLSPQLLSNCRATSKACSRDQS